MDSIATTTNQENSKKGIWFYFPTFFPVGILIHSWAVQRYFRKF